MLPTDLLPLATVDDYVLLLLTIASFRNQLATARLAVLSMTPAGKCHDGVFDVSLLSQALP